MTRSAVDTAYGRAIIYRFLSLAFAYPTAGIHRQMSEGLEALETAAGLSAEPVRAAAAEVAYALERTSRAELAADYRRAFTFSASPDCPLNESAYSARHVYQEVGELADIAGFYRAFGLEIAGERPDELAAELEFCGLLALKEALAREDGDREHATVARKGSQLFMRDHLGRWAENIGRRIELLAAGTAYARFGRLLTEFARAEIDFLKPGPIEPYQEIPNEPEPLDDGSCPAEEGLGATAFNLQGDAPANPFELVASPGTGGS
jgi:DMSO reductase family type II enzyme chaperone